jgi:hypothetical protein
MRGEPKNEEIQIIKRRIETEDVKILKQKCSRSEKKFESIYVLEIKASTQKRSHKLIYVTEIKRKRNNSS